MRCQRHRGNLCFVAHLGQKKGDQCGTEHAEFECDFGFFLFDFVGDQRPHRHGNE